MVDNENQWEDIEYTDNGYDDANYGSSDIEGAGYDDPDYSEPGNIDDFDEDYEGYADYEDGGAAPKKGGGAVILFVLLILLIGVGFFVFKMKQGSIGQIVKQPAQESVTQQQPADSTEMGDYFFNEANNNSEDMMSVNFDENGSTNVVTSSEQGDVVATVTDTPVENLDLNISGGEENAIMVSYSRPVRMNPFKPTDEALKGGNIPNDTGFEIVEPPISSVPDENLTKLLQTQISGILYDDESPSAIVNLNGTDLFVKVGDNVGGYLIEGITKNQVQITYKDNTYVASVGELFARGTLENSQAIVNLENKFAGRNRNK